MFCSKKIKTITIIEHIIDDSKVSFARKEVEFSLRILHRWSDS